MSRSRIRLFVGTVAGSAALIAVVGVALAAKPKPNYEFRTSSSPGAVSVEFVVSPNGKKLLDFNAGLAIKCNSATCGGFGGVGDLTVNSVKVKMGKFKASGNIYGLALPGHPKKKLGTETVTGRFVTSTKAKGKVTTHITLGHGAGGYHGVTKSFTAVGSPAVG